MAHAAYNAEQAGRRATQLYEREIRASVEPQHVGKYLVINLDNGEYVLGDDYLAVSNLAAEKYPAATRFAMRVGYPAVDRIGGTLEPIAR